MLNNQPEISNARRRNAWLVFSAAADFTIAVLHLVIIAIGPKGYVYFGAVLLALPAQRGEVWPAALMIALAMLFASWGCYALSGAGLLRPFPLLRAVLIFVSVLYILRGLIVIPDMLRLLAGAGYPLRQTVFSAGSLLLGLAHALGTARLLRRRSSTSALDV